MKKTVIIILALLPIVLLVMISVATHVFETYSHVEVENVVFTDGAGNALGEKDVITLKLGETKSTSILISPADATDKRVTYTSNNPTVCAVDKDGNITGVSSGQAIIMVTTEDGSKIAKISVSVTEVGVTGVTLLPDTLDMIIGENKDLQVTVYPYTAENKNVIYETTNPAVAKVTNTGKVSAVGPGTAIIKVTTVDGGFTDTCTVTVADNTPPISFDFSSNPDVTDTGNGFILSTSTLDLKSGLVFDGDEIDISDIHFYVNSSDAVVDENGILTFNQSDSIVKLKVYVGDIEDPVYSTDVNFVWNTPN